MTSEKVLFSVRKKRTGISLNSGVKAEFTAFSEAAEASWNTLDHYSVLHHTTDMELRKSKNKKKVG